MPEITPEVLKAFAVRGGWKERTNIQRDMDMNRGLHPRLFNNPQGQPEMRLPDFRANLQACVDVLERVCVDDYWSIRKQTREGKFLYYECYIGSLYPAASADTLNDAIILAVTGLEEK